MHTLKEKYSRLLDRAYVWRSVLPTKTQRVRKNARKGLSPYAAFPCSSLQSRFARVAARFRLPQFAAARSAGLLIPRSQVRIPARPILVCSDARGNRMLIRFKRAACAPVVRGVPSRVPPPKSRVPRVTVERHENPRVVTASRQNARHPHRARRIVRSRESTVNQLASLTALRDRARGRRAARACTCRR